MSKRLVSKRLVSANDQINAVIAEYRAGKRVGDFELLKALGLIVRNHEVTFDDPSNERHDYDPVPVPKALLYAIGVALVARRRQTREYNQKRSAKAASTRSIIEPLARAIMKDHPAFSDSEVARQVRMQFVRFYPRARCLQLRTLRQIVGTQRRTRPLAEHVS